MIGRGRKASREAKRLAAAKRIQAWWWRWSTKLIVRRWRRANITLARMTAIDNEDDYLSILQNTEEESVLHACMRRMLKLCKHNVVTVTNIGKTTGFLMFGFVLGHVLDDANPYNARLKEEARLTLESLEHLCAGAWHLGERSYAVHLGKFCLYLLYMRKHDEEQREEADTRTLRALYARYFCSKQLS